MFLTTFPQPGDDERLLLARLAQSLAILSGPAKLIYVANEDSYSGALVGKVRYFFAHGAAGDSVQVSFANPNVLKINGDPFDTSMQFPAGAFYPVPAGSTTISSVSGAVSLICSE